MGPMYDGCEQLVEVEEGEDVEITISALPLYTGGGLAYTPWTEIVLSRMPCLLSPAHIDAGCGRLKAGGVFWFLS